MKRTEKQQQNIDNNTNLSRPTITSKMFTSMACDLDFLLEDNNFTVKQRETIQSTISTLNTLSKETAYQDNLT